MSSEYTISSESIQTAAAAINQQQFAAMLDSTLLSPTATATDVAALVREALVAGTQLCVNECRIAFAARLLDEAGRSGRNLLSAVVGFPLGATSSTIKAESAHQMISLGADEIDMVANTGLLKEKNMDAYTGDIAAVAATIARFNEEQQTERALKVIIETCYLDEDEIVAASQAVVEVASRSGVPMFVKTSTGFGTPADDRPRGATLEHVALIRNTIGPWQSSDVPVGVKAAGGVRNATDAIAMLVAAGAFTDNLEPQPAMHMAARIGTSSAGAILLDFSEKFGKG